jgi:DNA primase
LGLIPDEVIAEIRDRADIVAVIGEHVQLKRAGTSWKGLCPFHGERTPSFNVSPPKRAYYCFGCQKSGDVFRFLMELQGKSFVEVAKELGARFGVPVPERPRSPEEERSRSEKSRLLEVNAQAAAFYRARLSHAELGDKGRAYLAARGIGDAVAELFRLGLAPDAWDSLATHLASKKVPVADALTLGLVAPRKSGSGYYDKFRDRLMCPVLLPAGEVVGFSGRTLGSDPETPKYVNSSESPVYKKSHLLFGLHAARDAMRKKDRAILVEGNFDVIALHQAGFGETVAPLGTALTPEQVDTLRRQVARVVLCTDGDKAGRAAALKDVVLCTAAGVDCRVVCLPQGEDPDSFVRKHGAAALEKRVAEARGGVEYYLEQVWFKTDRSPDALTRALRESAPLIASVADELRRGILVEQLARSLDVKEGLVLKALQQHRAQAHAAAAQAAAQARSGSPFGASTGGGQTERQDNPKSSNGNAARPQARPPTPPPPRLELKLIAILADHPSLLELAETLEIRSLLTDSRLRDMYSAARQGSDMLSGAPPEISDIVAREVFAGSYASVEDPKRTLTEALAQLRQSRLADEIADLSQQIKEAERRGDAALARECLGRLTALRQLKSNPQPTLKN